MGKKFHNLFKKQQKSDSLLTEFGESLLLIVDPEQLRNKMLKKRLYIWRTKTIRLGFSIPWGLHRPKASCPILLLKTN
ncbi:MAG: hypothetical protein ACYSU3_17430 [Planctomycetota bacterium]|jgi:hypothetical protein